MPKFRPEIHDEVEDLGNKRDLAKNKRAQKFAQKGQKNRKLDFQGKFPRNPNVQEDEVEISNMISDETRKQLEAISEIQIDQPEREEQVIMNPSSMSEDQVVEIVKNLLTPIAEKLGTVMTRITELEKEQAHIADLNKQNYVNINRLDKALVSIVGDLGQIKHQLGKMNLPNTVSSPTPSSAPAKTPEVPVQPIQDVQEPKVTKTATELAREQIEAMMGGK